MTTLFSVTPSEFLSFPGTDFDSQQTQKLILQNLGKTNMAFKVKTTALKAYLVRPSSGVLRSGEKIDIAIMLQKLPEIPQNGQHRFLVQAVETTETNIEGKEAWTQMTAQTKPHEFRLSVVFPDVNGADSQEPASGGGSYAGGANRDLESKYKELYDYTTALKERREELKREVVKLESGGGAKKGFSIIHISFAVILALFASKVIERLLAAK